MIDALDRFVHDPAVIPLLTLAGLSFGTFLLAIYRNLRAGTFDWAKLPQILDTLVLRKLIPLITLAVVAYAATDDAVKTALMASYVTLAGAALAAELKNFLDYVRNVDP